MSARILVVEDEEALTTLLRYNLDAEGYDVETVGRGDDADTRLKEHVPDLIVLDWMLPGLSGIELCRRLRARPETRQLPIIMLTARGEESERVRGLATGADDYIVKPCAVPATRWMIGLRRWSSNSSIVVRPRSAGTLSSSLRAKRSNPCCGKASMDCFASLAMTVECVARVERSATRGMSANRETVPDFASLHPGYKTASYRVGFGCYLRRSAAG